MKGLLSILLLISALTLKAAPSQLEANAEEICKLALLCDGATTEANTVKEMIFEYANLMDGEDPYEYTETSQLPEIDEVIWGRLTMRQALLFVRSFVDPDYGTITKEQADKINQAILNMRGTGVEFGFTPSTGGNVCGSVWPGLLIIDTKTKKIWDIGLFGYPQC